MKLTILIEIYYNTFLLFISFLKPNHQVSSPLSGALLQFLPSYIFLTAPDVPNAINHPNLLLPGCVKQLVWVDHTLESCPIICKF